MRSRPAPRIRSVILGLYAWQCLAFLTAGTKRDLAGEQSGGPLVSDPSRVALNLGKLYNIYIHPELRI